MYSRIVNPITNKFYKSNSRIGILILKKYLKMLKGGSFRHRYYEKDFHEVGKDSSIASVSKTPPPKQLSPWPPLSPDLLVSHAKHEDAQSKEYIKVKFQFLERLRAMNNIELIYINYDEDWNMHFFKIGYTDGRKDSLRIHSILIQNIKKSTHWSDGKFPQWEVKLDIDIIEAILRKSAYFLRYLKVDKVPPSPPVFFRRGRCIVIVKSKDYPRFVDIALKQKQINFLGDEYIDGETLEKEHSNNDPFNTEIYGDEYTLESVASNRMSEEAPAQLRPPSKEAIARAERPTAPSRYMRVNSKPDETSETRLQNIIDNLS